MGVGNGIARIAEWATYLIYLEGCSSEGDTLMRITKGAWVLDSPAPNAILGNDFLKPYEANIDYNTSTGTFEKIDDFALPFTVEAKDTACKCKVKIKRKITLAPG